jgi:hypothetical protein
MHLSDAGRGPGTQQRIRRGYAACGEKMGMRLITVHADFLAFESGVYSLLDCGHPNQGACDGYQRSV